jgi:hypothetical protein
MKNYSLSCIGYVAQTTDGYEERVTHSKASSQGYTQRKIRNIGVGDVKYLDKLSFVYKSRSITTTSNEE